MNAFTFIIPLLLGVGVVAVDIWMYLGAGLIADPRYMSAVYSIAMAGGLTIVFSIFGIYYSTRVESE
jgi:hypothetical protein